MASAAMNPQLAAALNETAVMPLDRLHEMGFVYRSIFYLVTPNETSFETLDEVPNYHLKVRRLCDCTRQRKLDVRMM
jgi:hypothetical protein